MKAMLRDYIRLLSFLKGHGRIFTVAVFFLLLSSLFEGVQFTLLVPFLDRVFNDKPIVLPNAAPEFVEQFVAQLNNADPDVLFKFLPIGFLLVMILKHAVTFAATYLMNNIAQRVMRDIRWRLFDTIQNLSMDFFSKKRTGELISRITNDVQAIENAISYAITDLFLQPFLIIVFVSIVFTIHLKGAILAFVMIPFIIWPMAMIGRRLRHLTRDSQEKMADIHSHLLETISGVGVVKAFGTEAYEVGRFKTRNYDFYKIKMKTIKRMLVISPITELVGLLFGIGIIYLLGQQVREGVLSFGIFTLFLVGFSQVIRPVKKLANVHAITQQALAANERIYDVLDAKPSFVEKSNAKELPQLREKIQLEDVCFRYDAQNNWVFENLNLTIKKGELVAIVGPTGTGKTTLVNLIPRFYDPTTGRVTFDGQDLKDVSFRSLRQQIGVVTQETILFNDTVRANIAYGQEGVKKDQIIRAAKQAFADQFITRMPDGYDTVIGDRGFRLSGGEKQRISIARAILRNPPILILDEATSQLDSESERFVQEALDKLMEGRTVVAIAHRFSTIQKADKIVVLDQGKIVGLGPHDSLLKDCPLYQRLHQMQFQG